MPIAGALGAVLQPITTGINAWISADQNKKQREFDLRQTQIQYAHDEAMWNKGNAYNSPASQMQRFKDAGLNPHLIYGQGTSGTTVVSPPKYQAPKGTFGISPLNVGNPYDVYQSIKLKDLQSDLLKAQIDSVNQDAINKQVTNGLLNLKLNLSDPMAFRKVMNEGTLGWENMGNKSLSEYSFDAKRLLNDQTSANIKKISTQTDLGDIQKLWNNLKLKTMQDTNVNIDKDSLLMRYVADIFGDIISKYGDKFKGTIKKYF